MRRSRTPNRSRTYVAVRKAGDAWEVVIMTPAHANPPRTPAARFAVRSSAIERAKELAALAGLTFREAGQ